MIGVWQKASHKRAMTVKMRRLCTVATTRETVVVDYPVHFNECS